MSETASQRKYNPETLIEAKMFELYYALGDLRDKVQLLPLVRKLEKTISPNRITRVSIKLFWEERIKARDYNQIVTLRESAIRNIDDLKLQFHDAIKNTVRQQFVTEKNKDTGEMETKFDLNIFNFNDLEKAIKLMLLLAGEATDITSVKIEIVNTVIQRIINVVSLHIKDPKILSQIAVELNNVVERS